MDELVLSVENSTHPLNLSAGTYKIKINAHIVVKNIFNPLNLAMIEV